MADYGYKPNRKTPEIPAQEVGEELERIRELRGELTALAIVEESKPKKAKLHKVVDWHRSNEECALDWRKHLARNIANVVTVQPEKPNGEQTAHAAPAFVNITKGPVTDPDSRSYEPIQEVLADPVQRADLVQRALEKLLRVQREFRYLNELASLWAAIENEAAKFATSST